MSLSPNDLYRFDEFELSPSRRTLLRNGEAVALLPKTFEVLSCLVENPGRVVAKEEIFKAVWRESFVEENNLTQHISLLRKALADRARYIATIPGRGYQFTAQVAANPQAERPSEPQSTNGAAAHAGNGSGHARPQPAPQPETPVPTNAQAGRKPQARISSFLAQLLRLIAH
jgi:DNA-binding winged helix-turn-helix (wHTH) protein